MKHRMDLPSGREGQLICHWIDLFCDREGSISFRG